MAATAASLAVPSPAHADAPSISIVAPTATVSGSFDVSVAISQGGTSRITHVFVQVFGNGEGFQSQDVPVDPTACAMSCTVTASFDSDGSVSAQQLVDAFLSGNVAAVPELGDGLASLSATAYGQYGELTSTSTSVNVDNQRPSFTAPALIGDPVTNPEPQIDGTPGELTVDVQGQANAESGQPVTSYELFIMRDFQADRVTVLTAPAPAPGDSSISFFDRSVPSDDDAGYYGVLVAVDGSGEESVILDDFDVYVPQPFTIGVTYPKPYTDEVVATVTPHWLDGSGPGDTWISSLTAVRNGVTIGAFSGMTGTHGAFNVTLAEPDGKKLARGGANIEMHLVDNFGVGWDVLTGPQLTDPVAVAWRSAPDSPQATTPVTATVSDASASPISHVDLAVDGHAVPQAPVSGSTYQVDVLAPATAYAVGAHSMTVTTALADGQSYTLSSSFTVVAPGAPTGTTPVEPVPPAAQAIPRRLITSWGRKSGSARVGRSVAMSPFIWSVAGRRGGLHVSYRWFVSGKPVAGATRRSYRIAASLRNKSLTVVITVAKAGYAPLAKSVSFGTVRAG